jgi:hypothetical protein
MNERQIETTHRFITVLFLIFFPYNPTGNRACRRRLHLVTFLGETRNATSCRAYDSTRALAGSGSESFLGLPPANDPQTRKESGHNDQALRSFDRIRLQDERLKCPASPARNS